jgi:hypothetical protein
LEGRQGNGDDDSNNYVALMEQVHLSLMRLPTNIASTALLLQVPLGDTSLN